MDWNALKRLMNSDVDMSVVNSVTVSRSNLIEEVTALTQNDKFM